MIAWRGKLYPVVSDNGAASILILALKQAARVDGHHIPHCIPLVRPRPQRLQADLIRARVTTDSRDDRVPVGGGVNRSLACNSARWT